jgi:hypothetical protein
MAKKKEVCSSSSGCGHGMHCGCMKWVGWTMLIVGVLYLLSDLNIFSWFGSTFSWFTIVFILIGLKMVCMNMCK